MRADMYMGDGEEVFKGQDPKYIGFLQAKANNASGPRKSWQFWK